LGKSKPIKPKTQPLRRTRPRPDTLSTLFSAARKTIRTSPPMFIKIQDRYINLNCIAEATDYPAVPAVESKLAKEKNVAPMFCSDGRPEIPGGFVITLITEEEITVPSELRQKVLDYLNNNLLT